MSNAEISTAALIRDAMNNWDRIVVIIKTEFPGLSDEQVFQAAAKVMSSKLGFSDYHNAPNSIM